MQKEFRRLKDINPLIFYQEDVIELIDIISIGSDDKRVEIQMDYTFGERTETVTSIEDLKKLEGSPSTDKFSFRALVWSKDRNIFGGLSLTLYHNYAQYQIHSINETWFLGKIAKLENFFRDKTPWYAQINKFAPFVSPLVILPAASFSFYQYKSENLLEFSILAILAAGLVFISYLMFKQRIFPYVKIFPYRKSIMKISYEKLSFIISIITLIVSVVAGIGIPLFNIKP